jgi:hypothetical protein
MRTVCQEYDHGEVIAEEELADSSKDEEHATEPDGGACSRDSETAGAAPSHWWNCQLNVLTSRFEVIERRRTEGTCEWQHRYRKAKYTDGCWVTEGDAKTTSHRCLGRDE